MTVDIGGLAPGVEALLRRAAAELIMPRYQQLAEADVTEKTPGELVTIADRETEAFLTEQLPQLLPGSRVVGEEACAADRSLLEGMAEGLVWVVDPLDGTANFAAGSGAFGTIVALAEDGRTVAGWTYDPGADRLCVAEQGAGAFVTHGSGEAERVNVPPPGEPLVASLATQFMPPQLRETVVAAGASAFAMKPIPRCAVEHYWRLSSGIDHVAMFQRTLPWDHAAGALFFQEAGGVVRRWNGAAYAFHDEQLGLLAAASEDLWQEAAGLLLGNVQDLPLVRH